jgi:hypothetical protein
MKMYNEQGNGSQAGLRSRLFRSMRWVARCGQEFWVATLVRLRGGAAISGPPQDVKIPGNGLIIASAEFQSLGTDIRIRKEQPSEITISLGTDFFGRKHHVPLAIFDEFKRECGDLARCIRSMEAVDLQLDRSSRSYSWRKRIMLFRSRYICSAFMRWPGADLKFELRAVRNNGRLITVTITTGLDITFAVHECTSQFVEFLDRVAQI